VKKKSSCPESPAKKYDILLAYVASLKFPPPVVCRTCIPSSYAVEAHFDQSRARLSRRENADHVLALYIHSPRHPANRPMEPLTAPLRSFLADASDIYPFRKASTWLF
jgi:hypothetical protein